MKLIALLFTLYSSVAFASFTGKFSGKGKATFKSGRVYECQEVFLDINESSTEFVLFQGGYRCGDLLNTEFEPFQFTIKNGDLIHEGKVFGKISDKEFSYSIYDPEDESTYYLSLKRLSDGIHYLEKWHDGESFALSVAGKLTTLY